MNYRKPNDICPACGIGTLQESTADITFRRDPHDPNNGKVTHLDFSTIKCDLCREEFLTEENDKELHRLMGWGKPKNLIKPADP